MKILLLLPLFLSFYLPSASADGSFEDTSEFLRPQTQSHSKNNNVTSPRVPETWSIVFELMEADGSSTILADKNREVLLKPASTMKLFTAWWPYKLGGRSDTYLAKMLQESDNAMADKTLAYMGGKKNLKKYYSTKKLDLNAKRFIQADGSGLSYNNKSSCGAQIDLLKLMYSDSTYEKFKLLLAQPGLHGTLETRLLELKGKVFAKTGTLNQTASLTGFLETENGTVVFCILSDYLVAGVKPARVKIDKLVQDYSTYINSL